MTHDARASRGTMPVSAHAQLCSAALSVAHSRNQYGVVESVWVDSQNGKTSRHLIDADIKMSALKSFYDTARHAFPDHDVFIGDHQNKILVSVCPRLTTSNALLRQKRTHNSSDEQVKAALYRMGKTTASLPEDRVERLKSTVSALNEQRSATGVQALESFSLQIANAPCQRAGSGAQKSVLLLSSRFAPGTALKLTLLLASFAEPIDGVLRCSNEPLNLNHALPLATHSSVAVELGLTTLQISSSVGMPFDFLAHQ